MGGFGRLDDSAASLADTHHAPVSGHDPPAPQPAQQSQGAGIVRQAPALRLHGSAAVRSSDIPVSASAALLWPHRSELLNMRAVRHLYPHHIV